MRIFTFFVRSSKYSVTIKKSAIDLLGSHLNGSYEKPKYESEPAFHYDVTMLNSLRYEGSYAAQHP